MNPLLAQIQDLQNKVNSLNDAREFYDLETASSPGLSHSTHKYSQSRRCDKIAEQSDLLGKETQMSAPEERINVEEQHARKKNDSFPRGRQIAQMIYDHSELLALMKLFLILQIHSVSLYKVTTFKIPIQDGSKLCWLEVKHPKIMSRNVSLNKMPIRESVQLQTVLALYKQEIDQT